MVGVLLVVAGCSVDGSGIGRLGDGGGGDASVGSDGAGQDGPAPDRRVDMAEAGADPDGPALPFEDGWPCTGSEGCSSGHCVDNVCCESPCNGPCLACARNRSNRPDGECHPIPTGLDPDQECSVEQNGCGRTGVCNGGGACALGAAGLACGSASCSGNRVTPPPRCDGAGVCSPQPAEPCAGNLRCANGSACKGTCAESDDCVTGSTCDTGNGQCSAPKPLGTTCDPADQGDDCASGHCVDGVCCDTACEGDCLACASANTGAPSGTCAPVSAGRDPDDDCQDDGPSSCNDDGTCDGAGECRKYPDGTTCGSQCCRGGGNRLCEFACRLGSCDDNTPIMRQQCGSEVTSCCCPRPLGGGEPACRLRIECLQCEDD